MRYQLILLTFGLLYYQSIFSQVTVSDSTKIILKDYIDSACLCPNFNSASNKRIEGKVKEVDEPAIYPNGDLNDFRIYIQECIKQPTDNLDHTNDKVLLGFIVDIDGSLVNPIIFKCNNPTLAREAIQCLKNSPKWIPAKVNGKNYKELFYIPIVYDAKK